MPTQRGRHKRATNSKNPTNSKKAKAADVPPASGAVKAAAVADAAKLAKGAPADAPPASVEERKRAVMEKVAEFDSEHAESLGRLIEDCCAGEYFCKEDILVNLRELNAAVVTPRDASCQEEMSQLKTTNERLASELMKLQETFDLRKNEAVEAALKKERADTTGNEGILLANLNEIIRKQERHEKEAALREQREKFDKEKQDLEEREEFWIGESAKGQRGLNAANATKLKATKELAKVKRDHIAAMETTKLKAAEELTKVREELNTMETAKKATEDLAKAQADLNAATETAKLKAEEKLVKAQEELKTVKETSAEELARVREELNAAKTAMQEATEARAAVAHSRPNWDKILPEARETVAEFKKFRRVMDFERERKRGTQRGFKFTKPSFHGCTICFSGCLRLCMHEIPEGCERCDKGVHLSWQEMNDEQKDEIMHGYVPTMKSLVEEWKVIRENK